MACTSRNLQNRIITKMKLDLCTEVTLIGKNATYIFVFENKVREGKPQICHIPGTITKFKLDLCIVL